MSRPPFEVADIIRAAAGSFFKKHHTWLNGLHRKVLSAIVRCRTAALGGHRDGCSRRGHQAISYSSCRNRHCPKCQSDARDKWLAARQEELLNVPYFHVVFTLLPLCRQPLEEAPHSETRAPTAALCVSSGARDDPRVRACRQCGGPMILIERLTALDLAREFSRTAVVNTS